MVKGVAKLTADGEVVPFEGGAGLAPVAGVAE